MARTNLSKVDSSSRPVPPGIRDGNTMVARSCFAVLVVCILVGGAYFARQSGTNAEAYSNDFNVYYHAAREVIAGHDPYQSSLAAWTPYLYPPLLAELLIPLAMLWLPIAAYLWFLISAASMFGAARMSASLSASLSVPLTGERDAENAAESERTGRRLSLQAAVAAAAILVVFRFVLDTFNLGQVNTVVAGLAVAHIYFYARDKKALSAIALVLAASIKLTPAVFLVYHVAKMRLKFAAACIAILAGVTALSFLPFEGRGVDAFRVFANRTVRNEQGYNLADPGNQSLRGAIARLATRANADDSGTDSRNPAEVLTLVIAALLLTFAVLAARRARSELAGAAPFFCCVVLLSPLSWKAHFVILVFPVAYLLSLLFQPRTPAGARRLALGTLATSFVLFNLTSPHVIGLAAAEWADAHSLVALGALLIFVATLLRNLGKFG